MADLGTVIITGGSSGLGAAVVAAVAAAGGVPHVLDRKAPVQGVSHSIVDLGDPRRAEEVTAGVCADAESVGAVVTCAAIDVPGDFGEVDGAVWDEVVSVNLLGTAAVLRAALPSLIADHGTIVTVASTLGLRALPAATAYSASKFAVVGMTRALALEVAGRVGVTLLVPGGMATDFFADRPAEYRPAPDQRLNDPAHVAAAVMFALEQPAGCEVREIVITPSVEPSWP